MDILFTIVPLFIFGVFAYMIYNFINEKILNDRAPILEIPVIIVEKRVETSTSSNNDDSFSTSNTYKVTFESLENRKRRTFTVYESEFNQVIEDDIGYLTYQRNRYHGFSRNINARNSHFNYDSKSSGSEVVKY